MELIDKAAIVAEIEKLKGKVDDNSSYSNGWEHSLRMIEIFIDSLEVKEVDLEKAIDKWICDNAITHDDCSITDVISTARHFFNLGLKAREGKE